MIHRNLYFKDEVLFATGYERIVVGKRGSYVELVKDHIVIPLISKFNANIPECITDEPFYYYWLVPVGRDEKIYWQCRAVKYADYKIGYYYISPNLLLPFGSKELF